jgi:hypothetical protein
VYSQLSYLKSKNQNYHPKQVKVPLNRQHKRKKIHCYAQGIWHKQTLVKCLEGFEMHSMSVTIVANLC